MKMKWISELVEMRACGMVLAATLFVVLSFAGCGSGSPPPAPEIKHKFAVGDKVRPRGDSGTSARGAEFGIVVRYTDKWAVIQWQGRRSTYGENEALIEHVESDALSKRLEELNAWSRKLYKEEMRLRSLNGDKPTFPERIKQ